MLHCLYLQIQLLSKMGLSASKQQWNEMNEVNQALEETENQVKNSSSTEKKSFKNKLRSRILKSGTYIIFLSNFHE